MIELIDCDIEDAVAWRISGKVSDDDMELALGLVKEKLESNDTVSVLQEIESFGGVELDAIGEKLGFLREFGISRFRRIAVLTDKRWMRTVVGWENHLFKGIEMRAFELEERDRAFNFLAYGDDPQAD